MRAGVAWAATTLETRVANSSNDAEESAAGSMNLNSTTLELVYNGGNQTVGMRWTGISIPKGATITAAYIQFYSSSAQSGATNLTFQGQAADNPATFSTATGNISSRPRTAAAIGWSPAAWASGESNLNERTPDLSAAIQEVVSRTGWVSGNALAMIVTGTGVRVATSYDGRKARAPLLHIEYVPPDYPPVASLSVTQPATPALTVNASGAGSTDTDQTPIGSYSFDFGDGSPVVTTTAPTSSAQHTYAAAGTYTVTLTATDTGNNTSTPVSKSITIQPDLPPVAGLSVSQLASPNFTVSASGSSSTDTDLTPIASYHFDFGDGSPVVNTTAPTSGAQHSYATVGTYTVTLTVTDTGNYTSSPVTASITVNPPPDYPPTASLSVSQIATPAFTVNADGSGSTDTDLTPIATYQFDFGDGSPVVTTTAPTSNAQHSYAAAGAYTVTLTATDTGNNTSAPVTKNVNVQPDLAPVAQLAVAQLASPPLTVNASGANSTDTDATPIATYQFDFGDGSSIVTTTAPVSSASHTYPAAGTYTVTLTATDTGANTSAPVTGSITVTATVASTITERRISASADDAEESSSAVMSLTSSDLELVYDGSIQTVGMRWLNLPIPPGSTITAAYIQFAAKEAQSEVTNLALQGQATDNPTTFTSTTGNVSTRPRTTASVAWSPVAWNVGEVAASQRTPDLTSVIQQIVSRPGWASGNAMVLIVTGTGHRTAWAWDGNAASAPLLHVEYVAPEAPPVARLNVSQALSPALTVNVDASGSTDLDATPIASYQFDFGDGSPIVTTTAPTATASHSYAAAGTYTVILTVTDTGNNTSAPASASINVIASNGALYAVYAGYYDTHHATNPHPKPDPWRGSPNTVFVGTQDNQPNDPPSGAWDSSCLRIDNLTTGVLSVTVTVDIGTHHYALWGTPSIPVGNHLVLAQTAFQNFDGSDLNAAGCYGCDPSQCTPLYNSTIPVVHVTVGGTTTNFTDSGQFLNTHGVDAAGCPYVGGPLPQTRYDESTAWQRIYPPGQAPPARSEPTSPAALLSNLPERKLWLSAPLPNPSRGEVFVRFTTPLSGPVRLDLYDLSGRLVRPCISNVLEAAGYGFPLNLSDVHPGIYFLHLATPVGSRNQKLVLMR